MSIELCDDKPTETDVFATLLATLLRYNNYYYWKQTFLPAKPKLTA